MLPLAHMGIGSKLVSPWSKGLPRRWVLLGTLLPDLTDKPLYYGLTLITGKHAEQLGILSGTRTFGHTALFLLALTVSAGTAGSRRLAAVSLGVATHLFLDNLGDALAVILGAQVPYGSIRTVNALLWPFLGLQFPIAPFSNAIGHVQVSANPFNVGAEVAGGLLLGWDQWKLRHESEILAMVRERRILWRRRQHHRQHPPRAPL